MFGSDGVQLFQYRRGPAVEVRSTLAAPIGTFPGRGKGPRDRHPARPHDRGSQRSREERGDSSALEQERLERPRGSMGALTGVRSRQKVLTGPMARSRWLI